MELSELTAYAWEKFHIQEQHKWTDFPGFSVLADPVTGKWIALMMRQWDWDTGTELQRCDIKCGRQALSYGETSYLSLPFRMKGKSWLGVRLDAGAQPEVVFDLLDQAVRFSRSGGYTLVLEDKTPQDTIVYEETPLPSARPSHLEREEKVPEKIREMMKLYQYGNGSFKQKCRNFYRQGKYMEDYEDNLPWDGEYRHYFPTYHDLSIRQLRGYFTWRTGVRKGRFSPVATSLAYLYLYELLNGIGTSFPEEGLQKMKEFEIGFLDSGLGDPGMYKNLHRWIVEYGVLHNVPGEKLCQYIQTSMAERDKALLILQSPKDYTDEEVFSALCTLEGKRLKQSLVMKKNQAGGMGLFAAIWRYTLEKYEENGKDFFTACFGTQRLFPWHPLANAVYRQEGPHPDRDYVLNGCRSYCCRNGFWYEKRYDSLYFDRKKFHGLLHEGDRRLRKFWKTGHYLRENPEEQWAAPYVEQVLLKERKAQVLRPQISIDLSGLERIRRDALVTRDSLLTEEEKGEEETFFLTPLQPEPSGEVFGELDPQYSEILLALFQGKSPEESMKAAHLMPSVVADTINEAFFDQIGDNVLEWDGSRMTVVEDYREEMLQIWKGQKQ